MNPLLQENLKKLMIKHGHISVSDLAKLTGLPQPTLYQLYTGVTGKPRKKTLASLAEYFSVSVSQLIGEEALPTALPKKIKAQLDINTAPLLTWDDLPHWPNQLDLTDKKEIFLNDGRSQTTFAVHMPDTSMEPLFPNGSLLIFDVEKIAKDQDCAIIYQNEMKQFLFKRILIRDEQTYAHSINPAFNTPEEMTLTKQDKILATLLEARLSF